MATQRKKNYETAEDVLDGLDPEQKKAAMATRGPVAIIAGAGTGKTRTITHRIAYGCRADNWIASEVLAVTFTAKAAKEMKERLEKLGISGTNVYTFHAAALKQVRQFWPKVVGTKAPKLETSRTKYVVQAAKSLNIEIELWEAKLIADEISWAKVSLIAAKDYPENAELMDREILSQVDLGAKTSEQIARIYDEYDIIKSEAGVIDFEDVMLLMIHLIQTKPLVAKEIRDQYKHIIVDEYQDVSPLQEIMLECWLGKSREICVVGDPSQTIYSFTGASAHYLLGFEDRFTPKRSSEQEVRKVELISDYRSSPQIVALANKILSKRGKAGYRPLKLISKAENRGVEVSWKEYNSDFEEAQKIAEQIKHYILKNIFQPKEIAILVRTNSSCRDFETALKSEKIPYLLKQELPQNENLPDSNDLNRVTIASLHSSKGLEWDCVFLAGLSDGKMPIVRARTDLAIEEERRLLYVGVTRAKEKLIMSYSLSKQGITNHPRKYSRFLNGIWGK
ncbi:MAG: ATP-dependent helicase [Candidatus Ancillula sp.]|jgi:DNA helicase-2/ATP-dependent DNA helicase PcrA|nr:ATP-dependent helicase [Candidatus Ancillula sp.]